MAYASGGLITATDYNGFVSSINSLWGVGASNTGYGQSSPLATVSAAVDLITATQWNSLIARINTISQHQTGSESTIPTASAGTTITYLAPLSTTISSLTNNRTTAFVTDSATTTTLSNSTSWNAVSTKEVSLTWANSNAMRYWFNSGGYISFTGKNSTLSGNEKSLDWDNLLTACGDIVVRASTSGKTGGSGTTAINNTNLGFYNLTTNYQTILQQFSPTVLPNISYTTNHVQFQAKINTVPSSATVMSLRMILTDTVTAFSDVNVLGSVQLGYSRFAPSTTYLSNVWGSVSVATITNTNVGSPFYVVGTNYNLSSGTSFAYPSGIQNGDFIIIAQSNDAGDVSTVPTDTVSGTYTSLVQNTDDLPDYLISYKRASGSESGTNVTITRSGSRGAAVIQVFRRVNTSNPFDVAFTSAASVVDGAPNAPSITTVTNHCLVVAIGFLDDESGVTISVPTGYSNLNYGESSEADGSDSVTMMASKLVSNAGVEDPPAFGSNVSDSWRAVTVALRPA